MKFKSSTLLLALCLPLPPQVSLAQINGSEPAPEVPAEGAAEVEAVAEQQASAEPPAARTRDTLPYDPSDLGLPDLPWPMQSTEDFQTALKLIDARIAEQEAALAKAKENAKAEAEAEAEAEAKAEGGANARAEADANAEAEADTSDTAPGDGAEDKASEDSDLGAGGTPLRELEPTTAAIERGIEVLRQLRVAVQRQATLHDRIAAIAEKTAQARERLELIERDGVAGEPPFLISQIDQLQAEQALKQAVEAMSETRLQNATRRVVAAERALADAVRARRAERDRILATEKSDLSIAQRDANARALELTRLSDLLSRQQLAAAEEAVGLARDEDRLAEAEQAVLSARVTFLEPRATLPREVVDERLEELTATEEALYAQIETLQRGGDEAESALYRARRALADAPDGADQAALSEWVAARQAELDAARASVDALTAAMANLNRMRALWEQRFALMENPDSIELPALLRQLITESNAVRAEKETLLGRLNALRSIQLAHARRLRDPALPDGLDEAMAVRSAAHDLAEQNGRELLETQDELIALLQGMRRQLEALVEEQNLSLRLLKAQETLAGWWDAELIVIDDQSIRARELVTALAMFVVVLIAVSLIRLAARRALKRRKARDPNAEYGDLRLVLSAIAGNTNQLFVLIAAFYVAMAFSGLASPTVEHWVWTALVVAFYAQLGIWANAAMADYFSRRRTRQEIRDPSTVTGYGVMMVFIRVGIWITVIVSLLAYFKYPVAGLVGALGVGSLAIAFAVQNILGDVFSSMAIILDKPFRVGDFVKTGENLGTIEHIGVKTTRIRSLSGEQLVVSNSDLLSSRIHNFKQFRERRVVFRIGVVYQTPRALLEQIPAMLRESVEEQPRTRFDRAHFFEFGDYALIFEVVYFVLSPDFGIYADSQQGINLGIHRRFEAGGISFAYPTQELILRRGQSPMAVADAAP